MAAGFHNAEIVEVRANQYVRGFLRERSFSQTLVDAGAIIETKTSDTGMTPLHRAAASGNIWNILVRHLIGSLLATLVAFADTAQQRRIQNGGDLRRENSVRLHMYLYRAILWPFC